MVNGKHKKKKEKDEGLSGIFGGRLEFRDVDEILSRPIKAYGNSAHVIVPKKHIGKSCQVTIFKEEKKEGGTLKK